MLAQMTWNSDGIRAGNPYSFLREFDKWWDFELRVRKLRTPHITVEWSVVHPLASWPSPQVQGFTYTTR